MTEGLRAQAAGGPAATTAATGTAVMRWWWTAFAALAGLVIITLAFRWARANEDLELARWLLWGGLGLLVVPAAAVLLDASTPRNARVAVIALVAVAMYLVKVLHDPVEVGFPDEFVHVANAQGILADERLYPVSEIIPASKGFPGLEATTVLLSQISGMGIFTSGLVLIGLARVIGLVAIYLLVERLSGSARVGGVAALVSCAAPNYVYWSAQYSYESLSLPLLLLTVVCVLELRDRRLAGAPSGAWWACAALLIVAVVVTHHLSSYTLAVLLWAMVLVDVRTAERRRAAPIALAVLATVAALAWTVLVAGDVAGYLGNIFGRAFTAVRESISGEAATRAPFQAGDDPVTNERPSLFDIALALGSVLLVGAGVVSGLLRARRRAWADPFAYLVMVGGPLLLIAFAARAIPGAWETGNRSTNYLYVGAAMLVALAAVAAYDRARPGLLRHVALPLCAFVLVGGGLVIGWETDARLPRPLEAQRGAQVQRTESRAFVDWARRTLPRDSLFLADETSSRLLAVAGFRDTPTTRAHGVLPLVSEPGLPAWERQALVDAGTDFVVLDRRLSSNVPLVGMFLPRKDDPREFYLAGVPAKFEGLPGVRLVYDSGDIRVYDVRDYVARARR